MPTIAHQPLLLIDPSLRRARRVRAILLVSSVAVAATLASFGASLRPEPRSPPHLPSPRHALALPVAALSVDDDAIAHARAHHATHHQARAATHEVTRGRRAPRRRAVSEIRTRPAEKSGQRPVTGHSAFEVTAFLDPSAQGALVSLDRHAEGMTEVAMTGLLAGDRGAVIDQLDEAALDVARSHHLPILALVQNLDERTGAWRPDRALALGDLKRRQRFARELAAVAARRDLAGIHLDLESLDDRWKALVPVAEAVARELHAAGRVLAIDVPSELPGDLLRRLAAVADEVVVMAYDEHEADGAPGPVASAGFVARSIGTAASAITDERGGPARGRIVAGLGLYGYDWVNGQADPVSFVGAHLLAREARAEVAWDAPSGNAHVSFADDEGTHDTWLLDAAVLWNATGIALRSGVTKVALWRLGGEDPGTWDVLAARRAGATTPPPGLDVIPADDRVENHGDGPFLALALSPAPGHRALAVDGDRIASETIDRSPSPWLVRRAGKKPGQVALTFDDGPDASATPAVLDLLREAGAPAAFFVVGSAASAHPELVRRAFAEGHTVGNHTFSHPDVDAVSTPRLEAELEATARLVESLLGRRPLLYRPPSLRDIEPRTPEGAAAFARAGALGDLVVDADVDPRDWSETDSDALVARVLEGAADGGVILLHDGGGDRSTTVRALPRIIAGLRARNLAIVPLESLVDKTRDEVMPVAAARGTSAGLVDRAVFGAGSLVFRWTPIVVVASIALVLLRALLIVALAFVGARRQRARAALAALDPRPLPSVTVVIPAYNERAVIERTIDSVLASDVPARVIVVDDGSTDGTGAHVLARFGRDSRVDVIIRENGGKASALRVGFASARTEVVVALDGDTLFLPDTVRRLVEPMRDPRVGAVAGTCDVGNRGALLTECQALEYLSQQELERRAWDVFEALPVVPGAVGAWRKRAVAEVGGFSSATLAEDADLAMALGRAGWRVVHAPDARARTEAPESVSALLRQRARWSFGTLQAMWRHRRALVEQRAGALGRLVLPMMILSQVLLPIATPLALAATVAALVTGHVAPALIAAAVLLACEALQALAAARLGGVGVARGFGGVLAMARVFLLARLAYRPLLVGVLLRAAWRAIDGVPIGWNKLARRGTVTA